MEFFERFYEVALGFVIEFLKLMPIMIFIFGFKLQPARRIVIFGLSAVALLILSVMFGIEQYVPIYSYISMLLTFFIVRGNNRILYTLISFFSVSILDMLIATVWLAFSDRSYVQLSDDITKSIIINSINIVTIVVICIAARIFFSKNKHLNPQNISRTYLILLLIGELSLSVFISMFQYKGNSNDTGAKVMAICFSIGSVIFLLTAFILLINHISKKYFKENSEINEKLIKSQERYYLMLLQKEEETRKFRHDINNHLNCLKILFNKKNYSELGKYLEDMRTSVQNLRSEFQIGNDFIGAILKDVSDKHSDVSVNIVGRMPPRLHLDNMDICTIFYNLFDNAFAASDNSEKKFVEISIKLLNENLFFSIKNSISHKIEIVNNILTTEKNDISHHGFGSGNAVKCAEKNGGELIFKCTDTYFEAELVLPNIDSL